MLARGKYLQNFLLCNDQHFTRLVLSQEEFVGHAEVPIAVAFPLGERLREPIFTPSLCSRPRHPRFSLWK